MRSRLLVVLLTVILVISLCACSIQEPPDETEVGITFLNNSSDDIYCIQIEYLVNRMRIGGISASADPGMTMPLKKDEKVYFGVSEQFIEEYESNIPFGMLVYVFPEEGNSVPIKFLWEWSADFNTEYNFSISGSEENGYAVNREGDAFMCTVTPWDELPAELLE